MRVCSKPIVTAALTLLAALGLAAPAISDESPPLFSRQEFCYNAPGTVAGTLLGSRALVAKNPRPYRMSKEFVNPQLWCAPHCATYIRATYISAIPGQSWGLVQYLMGDAEADAQKQLRALGDVNIRGGLYVYRAYGLDMFIRDSNNHQLTWGVLREALRALTDYFGEIQRTALPGSLTFIIYDGKNEVATGAFGAVQGGR